LSMDVLANSGLLRKIRGSPWPYAGLCPEL
jgi:hypothetical protein